ncbi:unnamed protein product [Symbiodinium natans]|uniref:Calmodulin-lysine N-methyltransferase n=1 Tax=Symbiodinium natans TaxID=878477 RepID=A0A812M6E2_9DINO|nr:unnamed protein product [Symbiodinium natans]
MGAGPEYGADDAEADPNVVPALRRHRFLDFKYWTMNSRRVLYVDKLAEFMAICGASALGATSIHNFADAGGYATTATAAEAVEQHSLEEASAKTKSKLRKAKAAEKAQRRGKAPAETQKMGTCEALAVEWAKEAQQPTLPEGAFELLVICDCLYENRESWEALRCLLRRLPAPSATVLFASAMLRKPFLQAFVALLQEDGFLLLNEEEGGHLGDVCIAILQPQQVISESIGPPVETPDISG